MKTGEVSVNGKAFGPWGGEIGKLEIGNIELDDGWSHLVFKWGPSEADKTPTFMAFDEMLQDTTPLQQELVERLAAAIPPDEQVGGEHGDLRRKIIAYNDATGRTEQEIIDWYERALVLH